MGKKSQRASPVRPTVPEKTRFTSGKGDAPARQITVMNLLERISLIPDLRMDQMIDDLGVDREELYAILANLARSMPREAYQVNLGSLHGVLSWGIAIGYFFAKESKTFQVN